MKTLIERKILALLPHYTEEGANYTKVKVLDGEEGVIEKNINSTLKAICAYYHYDLRSSKKTCREVLGIKKTPPLAIKIWSL